MTALSSSLSRAGASSGGGFDLQGGEADSHGRGGGREIFVVFKERFEKGVGRGLSLEIAFHHFRYQGETSCETARLIEDNSPALSERGAL